MTDFESYARAAIKRVAEANGLSFDDVIAEQERALYTLAASRLAETAGDERKRSLALAAIEECLEDLRRGA